MEVEKKEYYIVEYSKEIIDLELPDVCIYYYRSLYINPRFDNEGSLQGDIIKGIPGITISQDNLYNLIRDRRLHLAVPGWVVELFDLRVNFSIEG